MISNQELIEKCFSSDLSPAVGSITRPQARFLVHLVETFKPKIVCEVGVASGRSTAVLGLAQERHGGYVKSFDTSTRYYDDHSKSVGFLCDEIRNTHGGLSNVEINLKKGSLNALTDLEANPPSMVFIDAGHAHPWPTIDTLMLAPLLKAGDIIVHHDLNLFRNPAFRFEIGPQILLNAVSPESILLPYEEVSVRSSNIFGMRMSDDVKANVAEWCATSLLHPWTAGKRRPDGSYLAGIDKVMEIHYSKTSLPAIWKSITHRMERELACA